MITKGTKEKKFYGKNKTLYKAFIDNDKAIIEVYHSNWKCIGFIKEYLDNISGLLQFYQSHYQKIENFKNNNRSSRSQFLSQAHSYLGIIVLFDYISYFKQDKVKFIFQSTSISKEFNKQGLKSSGEIQHSKTTHNERCPKCKEIIKKFLEKIYGNVIPNYKFVIGTKPEDFKTILYYGKLKEIYKTLQEYRGFKKFVKTETLPNCDFFVPNPGFIVEFDESQHFTLPRKIALEHYPQNLQLGFDRKMWIKLCETIKAKDNDPPDRDEKRAWYDTLRDFLPEIMDLKPTVRLFAKSFVWCDLDSNNSTDVYRFIIFLKEKYRSFNIRVDDKEDIDPFLARIIVKDEWEGAQEEAKRLLLNVYESWPKGKKVKIIITCGGFIEFEWPKSLSRDSIVDIKKHNDNIVKILINEAEKTVKSILDDELSNKLQKCTDYITLGIDSHMEKNNDKQPHIEFVTLIDLKNNKFYWTGKSYPTSGQQAGLVRISDLSTHFIELQDIGKILILGCHDLNMFNNRGYKNAGTWRKEIIETFRERSKQEEPILVLQHPHATDSIYVWRNGWKWIEKNLRRVVQYASAGRYYHREGKQRSELNVVLEKTKYGNTLDFTVEPNKIDL